jgi:hypothetical protein
MKKCKVCGDKTKNGFNIDLKRTPICESCANSIMLQQSKWLVDNYREIEFVSTHPLNEINKKNNGYKR